MRKLMKKRGGIASDLIFGTGALIIGVIVVFVILETMTGAGLLTDGGSLDNATDNLVTNLTTGVSNVGNKIPTVLLVAAVVIVFSVLVVLAAQYRNMKLGGGSSL